MSLLVRLHDGTEYLGVELVTVAELRRRSGVTRPPSASDHYGGYQAHVLLDGVTPAWLCPVIEPASMLGVIEQSAADRREARD